LILLALPREAHQSCNIKWLAEGLGKTRPIELQRGSAAEPKPVQPSFPIVIGEWERNSREVIRVALDLYNGRHAINARVWYRAGDAVKPIKFGITLAAKHLPALSDAMGKALDAARHVGLLNEGGEP
jgi:hypothetical protein